ncbi:hypothetical protein [Agromyces sp. NDB4Y10]|uniref:hypothetical protein n=1 Tax=Agromyces sp. NDB4Y10 TaxID=1775951 RepID=UPI0012F7E35B|nr:hypothetical protein [Agromyces sp. NDB4Y10]
MSTIDAGPRPRRPGGPGRPTARVVVAAAAAVVLVAIAVVVAVLLARHESESGAAERLARAGAAHAAAAREVERARDGVDEALDAATTAASLAAEVADVPVAHVGPEPEASFAGAVAELAARIDAAEALPHVEPEVPAGAREGQAESAGDLDATTRLLEAETARLAEHAADLGAAEDGLAMAVADVGATGADLLAAVPAAAGELEAAHESARNLERLALREATAIVEAARWDSGAADAIARYVAAAEALIASHEAEEAEKAGPLYERRKQVEAFARELSGGLPLEFDWETIVLGYGTDGTYAGRATWDVAGGGIASLTFSHSVAELWDAPGVRALVAHEVGHAMTGRCLGEIVPDELAYGDGNEAWATAWAISRGYTGDGSGEWIYGRPGDDVIALAAQCR